MFTCSSRCVRNVSEQSIAYSFQALIKEVDLKNFTNDWPVSGCSFQTFHDRELLLNVLSQVEMCPSLLLLLSYFMSYLSFEIVNHCTIFILRAAKPMCNVTYCIVLRCHDKADLMFPSPVPGLGDSR